MRLRAEPWEHVGPLPYRRLLLLLLLLLLQLFLVAIVIILVFLEPHSHRLALSHDNYLTASNAYLLEEIIIRTLSQILAGDSTSQLFHFTPFYCVEQASSRRGTQFNFVLRPSGSCA